MTNDTVTAVSHGGILRLTINRPDKLNALNADVHAAMMDALQTAERDADCRVVVLTGAGRAFCAGQDLSGEVYNPDGPQPDVGLVVERYNGMIERMRRLPKPIIGAVNGIAAGAGASIAFACDIVIARRSASFLQAFAKIGLVPDCGGTYFLPRLAGEARARGMALLAEPVKADQAEAWGMIWKAVDDDKLDAEVDALATRLAGAATYGLGLTKLALLASSDNDLGAQLALERDYQRLAGASPDYVEGVGAFLAKRAPNFTGRKG
ncbi:MAG: 2-(1,2-epoxy-1,2-dihydrophenyl)acetyl-CoA isomerase PaaG [Hyphomicrobiaceae bacterium]